MAQPSLIARRLIALADNEAPLGLDLPNLTPSERRRAVLKGLRVAAGALAARPDDEAHWGSPRSRHRRGSFQARRSTGPVAQALPVKLALELGFRQARRHAKMLRSRSSS
jgi:hypothetical protein